jgi:hypothetical protein
MRAAALTSPGGPGRPLTRAGQVRTTPGVPTIWKGTD